MLYVEYTEDIFKANHLRVISVGIKNFLCNHNA